MNGSKEKPALNMRYYNKEIDDDLPYVGTLSYDEETGHIYDEEGDVVDEDTIASFLEGDGRGTTKMSNSSLISYTKLSPNHSGKRTKKIDTVTIHCMAGQLSVESCGALFAKSSKGRPATTASAPTAASPSMWTRGTARGARRPTPTTSAPSPSRSPATPLTPML